MKLNEKEEIIAKFIRERNEKDDKDKDDKGTQGDPLSTESILHKTCEDIQASASANLNEGTVVNVTMDGDSYHN